MRGGQSSTAATAIAAAAVGLATAASLLLLSRCCNKKKQSKQVILITGASSGIGKATALKLLSQGHIVYGAARRVDRMKDIQQAGGHVLAMDICDESQIQQAVDQILREQNQRLDVLINNAGYSVYGALEVVSMQEARRQFEVNLFGLATLTQKVIPIMRQQKSGTIINISSAAGRVHAPFGSWYHASKHALEGLSDCCRIDLQPFGINVVIVEPGMVKTDLVDASTQAMTNRSKGTAYETSALACIDQGIKMAGYGSDASLIANVIAEAVHAQHPKRRYVAGTTARELLFIRNWLGDAVYDAIMLSMMK